MMEYFEMELRIIWRDSERNTCYVVYRNIHTYSFLID